MSCERRGGCLRCRSGREEGVHDACHGGREIDGPGFAQGARGSRDSARVPRVSTLGYPNDALRGVGGCAKQRGVGGVFRAIVASTKFDLRIRSTPDRLLLEASVEDRKADHESPWPFGQGTWDDFVSWPVRDARPVGRKSPLEEVEEVGRRLFEAVFVGKVERLWRTALLEASRNDRPVRLCLHLRDRDRCSDWPWEWLYDSESKSFLSISVNTPLIRYPAALAAARPLRCHLPLRILVVAASPPGVGSIDVQREWDVLQASLQSLVDQGEIELDLLKRATLSELRCKLRKRFHILHFIGHGYYDRDRGEGGLLFEDGEGGSRRVTGRDLSALVEGRRSLSLIVLNACEGAKIDAVAPSPGVAQSLALSEIPAVVAMQFKISDPLAINFAGQFYEALADGDPVDVAMAEARQAMFFADRDGIEWGTPVLFLRSSDGRIFEIVKELPPRGESVGRLWMSLKRTWLSLFLLGAGSVALTLGIREEPLQPPDAEGCPSSEVLGMTFVRIEPGTFIMGSKPRDKDEINHKVTISKPFCMSEHEVTRGQWKKIMEEDPGGTGADDLPVTNVSWDGTQVFLDRLNKMEPRKGSRLPTEAQWEYAARVRPVQRFLFSSQYGNCEGNDRFDGLAPVKSFAPNLWGLYDMHGNVSEWVADWYAEYPPEPVIDPSGPEIGEEKVRRGGSFKILVENCDSVTRKKSKPGYRSNDVGFRLVRTPEE